MQPKMQNFLPAIWKKKPLSMQKKRTLYFVRSMTLHANHFYGRRSRREHVLSSCWGYNCCCRSSTSPPSHSLSRPPPSPPSTSPSDSSVGTLFFVLLEYANRSWDGIIIRSIPYTFSKPFPMPMHCPSWLIVSDKDFVFNYLFLNNDMQTVVICTMLHL